MWCYQHSEAGGWLRGWLRGRQSLPNSQAAKRGVRCGKHLAQSPVQLDACTVHTHSLMSRQ